MRQRGKARRDGRLPALEFLHAEDHRHRGQGGRQRALQGCVGGGWRRVDELHVEGQAARAGGRWGVELFAAQIEGLVRGQTIRPLGALTQWLLTSAAALGGAALLLALRQRPAWLRGAALAAGALLLVVGAVLWYRSELQLIGLPYVLVAWAGGAWLGWRMARRSKA